MPAQNTARPQPTSQSSSQPKTQQGTQPTYQAKPARRTHRRLLTPPLAQKNGIDPIQLILPRVEELPADSPEQNCTEQHGSGNHCGLPDCALLPERPADYSRPLQHR